MTCILVLGVPRSGTSAVAHVCRLLGVPMGEHLTPETPMNPAGGACQDEEFEQIVEQPQTMPARLPAYRAKRSQAGQDWGLKSHRLHRALPFLVPELDSVNIIRTHRPLERCRRSWIAGLERNWRALRTDAPPAFEASLIDEADAALAVYDSHLETLQVDFDRLLDAPAAAVGEIAAFLGRPCVSEAVFHINAKLRKF
jgi:hypothetical protein